MVAAAQPVLSLVLPLLAIAGALFDVTSYRIPNWIPLALAAGFIPAALVFGLSLADVALHVGVGLAALLAGTILFALRVVGGGDAKLLAAAALWMGWPAVGAFLGWTGIAGGVLTAALILLRRPPLHDAAQQAPAWVRRLAEPGGGVPYGIAIAVGALAAHPASDLAAAF